MRYYRHQEDDYRTIVLKRCVIDKEDRQSRKSLRRWTSQEFSTRGLDASIDLLTKKELFRSHLRSNQSFQSCHFQCSSVVRCQRRSVVVKYIRAQVQRKQFRKGEIYAVWFILSNWEISVPVMLLWLKILSGSALHVRVVLGKIWSCASIERALRVILFEENPHRVE